jgi:DNA-nicking Smr family endonuclease
MISPDFPKKYSDRRSSGSSHDGDGYGGDGEDAHALWAHVTKDVKPLTDKNLAPAASVRTRARRRHADVRAEAAQGPAPLPSLSPPAIKAQPGAQEVDRRTAQRLKRGQYQIDVSVDLHGLTQAAAHKKLTDTLLKAYARQLRCVLVITGKGSREAGTGVIKQAVPTWLQEPALRAIVLRAEAAKPEHGGAGAMYVLLRRQRTRAEP